jgi:hypothetical protein
LKAALKKHNHIIMALVLGMAMLTVARLPQGHAGSCHAVGVKEFIICTGESVKRVPVGGKIIASCDTATGMYYCVVRDDGGGDVILGYLDARTLAIGPERVLPIRATDWDVVKMMAGDGVVFLFVVPAVDLTMTGDLIRVRYDSGEISRIRGILDFFTTGADCFMIQMIANVRSLVLNEASVPLSINGIGHFRIREVLDGRLVVVSAGEESEIIDIRAGKSLYQYASGREFMAPDSFNLLVQVVDSARKDQDEREMIFYKVFVDGIESGRTDTGPAILARETRIMLDPNRYHLIRMERWVLNSAKGRYDRENNIRQPKMQQIYIPMNRIVKLFISFNNRDYVCSVSPVYK